MMARRGISHISLATRDGAVVDETRREPGRTLLDVSQQDRALRDLMPILDWLASANNAGFSGATITGAKCIEEAYQAFLKIPEGSPAIKAYARWLDERIDALRALEKEAGE